jgi:hypothetical protein
MEWACIRAGAIPLSKEPVRSTQGVPLERKPLGEDPVLANQRERCLAQLLAQDLIREEDKWLDYEMEEAQVKIDLSDIVLEKLVGEAVEIL